MASIIDSCTEAFTDNFSYLKFIGYSIPVYIGATAYLQGNTEKLYTIAAITAVLFITLLTQGIYNVRSNKSEVLSINPIDMGLALVKFVAAIVPLGVLYWFAGTFIINNISAIFHAEKFEHILQIVVWVVLGSLLLTSYLSFAKKLKILQAYNFKLVFDSCVDVFMAALFFIPMIAIPVAILVAPMAYLFHLFGLPYNHWGFVLYCSMVSVVALSITANYFAQVAFETIKSDVKGEEIHIIGVDEDKDKNND